MITVSENTKKTDRIKLSIYCQRVVNQVIKGDQSCPQKAIEPHQYDTDFKRFAEYLKSLGLADRTVRQYLLRLKDFDAPITKDTLPNFRDHIVRHTEHKNTGEPIDKHGREDSEIIRQNYLMRVCLNHYINGIGDKELLSFLPEKRTVPNPAPNPRTIDIRPGEIKQMYDNSFPLYKMLISFLSVSGCRISECLWLQVKDIDFDTIPVEINLLAHITKGKRKSVAYLTDAVAEQLKEFIKENKKTDDDYIFVIMPLKSKRKLLRTVEAEQLEVIFALRRAAGKRISKTISPHTFRRLFASKLYNEKKLPIQSVQNLLRHKSITTSMMYLATDKKKDKEAYMKAMN